MTDPERFRPDWDVYLLPGEIHCARTPTVVATVLGSCIAVCLWDVRLRLGGMNHYVLPESGRGEDGARYGDVAIETLIERLQDLGGHPRDWQAKVFGGAAVLPMGGEEVTVGQRNVEMARERLRRYRIPILAQSTGGSRGRLIRLHTATGSVDLRKLSGAESQLDPPPN